MDANGMAVSLTSTINLLFGSSLMEPTTGIIFNNEMDDFSSPGFNNTFGLPPSPANFIVPGKRPQSSSCPVVVERDLKLEMALGGSGGSRITTGVASVLINMQDYNMDPLEAIVAKRFHHQLHPDVLLVEEGTKVEEVDVLRFKGHHVQTLEHGWFMSIVNGCRRMPDGSMLAAADPRKGGEASGC
jgi:gamma-glutamyltranspeptidase/glutathione hydrolase/leukotriene-C4 hydrolase